MSNAPLDLIAANLRRERDRTGDLVLDGRAGGVLPAAGLSMPQRTVQQNAADLVRAVERVEAELGVKPTLLAVTRRDWIDGEQPRTERKL